MKLRTICLVQLETICRIEVVDSPYRVWSANIQWFRP